MQLQDHDEWSGSCHSTGCLVHLAAPTFQVFPLHRFGLHLADLASDSEGVDLFQVSQGLVDLRRPGRMRPLGNDGYITCTNQTHPTKHANIWDKNSTCKEPASTLGTKIAEIWLSCLDTCPISLGNTPTTLAGKTSPNFGKIRVASQPPTTAAWCFSSGARCKSYPCWDSISHSILYGRNICSPVKVQTHEYVMN